MIGYLVLLLLASVVFGCLLIFILSIIFQGLENIPAWCFFSVLVLSFLLVATVGVHWIERETGGDPAILRHIVSRLSQAVAEGILHLPEFYNSVQTLHQVVDIDYTIPGCPPEPQQIWNTGFGGMKPIPGVS